MKNYIEVVIIVAFLGLMVWHSTRTSSPEVRVQCKTTKGDLEILVEPGWSPRGAERFLQMVDDGYFTQLPLFRCVKDFVCQFGPPLPKPDRKIYPPFADDPHISDLRNFKKGFLSFAGISPNSRAYHIFIALTDAPTLGSQSWETPFGYISDATYNSTVVKFTTKYGEMPPFGKGPEVMSIETPGGAEYLKTKFPELDYFLSCSRH
jgi:cyclophilin family peptidyl-prolyl cis-trans isomerase